VDGAIGRRPVHPIKRNGSAHAPAGTGSLEGCLPTKLLDQRSEMLTNQALEMLMRRTGLTKAQ
jgi:hypothetical protein